MNDCLSARYFNFVLLFITVERQYDCDVARIDSW